VEDLERRLLYRLLSFNPGLHGFEETVRVGEVPPDFPLSLPPDTTVLGSLEQRSPRLMMPNGGLQLHDHVRVMVDTPLPIGEFLAGLRQGLSGDWQRSSWPPSPAGGFVTSADQGVFSYFNATLERMLTVEGRAEEGVTQAMLTLNEYTREQFEQTRAHHAHHEQLFTLTVPEGVTVMPYGGGSNGQESASVFLGTSRTNRELFEAFSREMASQGWNEQARTLGEEVSSAGWSSGQGGVVVITLRAVTGGFAGRMAVTRPEQIRT